MLETKVASEGTANSGSSLKPSAKQESVALTGNGAVALASEPVAQIGFMKLRF